VWRPLADDLREPPPLNVAERVVVVEMLMYSRQGLNQTNGIDFDKIVTDAVMREYLGYNIPESKVLLDRKGKSLRKKVDAPEAFAPGGVLKKPSKAKSKSSKIFALGDASKGVSERKIQK
jgi:hypothetical protein